MEYFVYLPDVGMERVGIEEEEEEEEEENHLRKEPVPYCVNYKEFVQWPVNEIYMLVLL
jgi:hypothetical protein